MLIVVAFETKNKDGSDYIYFKSIVSRFYKERGTGISIKPVFMNGKGNYKKIENKISHLVNQYSGRSQVIYFFDIDNTELKFDQQQLNREIIEYCNTKKYEIVWYNKTVEDVLIGNVIEKDKTKTAFDFFYKDKIKTINEDNLSINSYEFIPLKKSNVKHILDKYLVKK